MRAASPPKRICVFCGSNAGASPAFGVAARDLGTTIASAGHELVYGGGRVGLMGAVADAALEVGGVVTGVIPLDLVEREVGHRGLTRLETCDSMHARKARMAELADGFVVLPGGFGTLDEVMEILTWNQLGLISAPVAFLDVDGFFDPLFRFMDDLVSSAFVSQAQRGFAQRVTSAAEAVDKAAAAGPATSSKWIDPE